MDQNNQSIFYHILYYIYTIIFRSAFLLYCTYIDGSLHVHSHLVLNQKWLV